MLRETQELPDLSAVVFDRAARPLVARVQICRYVDLVGDVDDDSAWNIVLLARKAPFEHERFEQDGEAEARCAGLVREQFKFFRG